MSDGIMARCSVCGREMSVKRNERGEEYAVQMCGNECMGAAWGNVTDALRRGVRPKWREGQKTRKFRLSDEERVEILELSQKGLAAAEIAEIVDRSAVTVRYIIANYDLVEV